MDVFRVHSRLDVEAQGALSERNRQNRISERVEDGSPHSFSVSLTFEKSHPCTIFDGGCVLGL